MVVTRVCSESVASEALNIHRALENGKGLYVFVYLRYFATNTWCRVADNNNIRIINNNLLLLLFELWNELFSDCHTWCVGYARVQRNT